MSWEMTSWTRRVGLCRRRYLGSRVMVLLAGVLLRVLQDVDEVLWIGHLQLCNEFWLVFLCLFHDIVSKKRLMAGAEGRVET